jgi:UDP-N-acetylmuramate dehydrogenase
MTDMDLIQENVPLKPYNTFGIDVLARYLHRLRSTGELSEVLSFVNENELSLLILGGGSNILFTGDYAGFIIKNELAGITIEDENEDEVLVNVGGGVIWHELVTWSVERGLGGLENLSLIPGCTGAAPIQNIGAYGVEQKDVFDKLTMVSLEDGTSQQIHAEDCRFGYRDSIFKQELKGKVMITNVTYRLKKDPEINTSYGAIENELDKMGVKASDAGVADVSNAVINIRRSKLPDPSELGNAGSFFKNPVIPEEQFNTLLNEFPDIVGYPASQGFTKVAAGWLIESCGWKGKRVGDTGSHAQQALVLVNYGSAKGADVVDLSMQIRESVKKKFGIEISPEVNII